MTILKPIKALAAQSDKLFETQLAKCPLPPGFWRGSDIFKHDMSGFHALTIKPLTFTSIMTGSIGVFSCTDDPPLYDGIRVLIVFRRAFLKCSELLTEAMKFNSV